MVALPEDDGVFDIRESTLKLMEVRKDLDMGISLQTLCTPISDFESVHKKTGAKMKGTISLMLIRPGFLITIEGKKEFVIPFDSLVEVVGEHV